MLTWKIAMQCRNNKVHLIRVIDASHIRYYIIELSLSLFGDIVVERIYGNQAYKKPTRKITRFLDCIETAKLHFETIKQEKIRKGYTPKECA